MDVSDAFLAKRIAASPLLRVTEAPFPLSGADFAGVSGVAAGSRGLIYIVQRKQDADPILVFDAQGQLVRLWGNGDFTLPHSVRIDRDGNIWAIDAGASRVIEYSPVGTKLTTISIEPVPDTGSPFRGATDIAFAPSGDLLITDGYGNSRVLECTSKGKKVRAWGSAGSGPGQFHLPHAIQVGSDGDCIRC